MRMLGLVMVLGLASCKASPAEVSPCSEELTSAILPALQATVHGGDADAFHRKMERFSEKVTMCGPDFAKLLRDWETTLREPDPTKAQAGRDAVLVLMRDLVAVDDMKEERGVLAPLLGGQ